MPYLIKPSKSPLLALLLWLLATVILPLIAGSVVGSIHREGAFIFSVPFIVASLALLIISSRRIAGADRWPLHMLLILGGLLLIFGMLSVGCIYGIPSQH